MTKVSSLVKERDKPVIAKDFNKKAVRRLTFTFNGVANDAEGWNRFFKVTPKQAARMLLAGLPKKTQVEIELKKSGDGLILYSAPGILTDRRSFDLRQRTLNQGYVQVFPAYRERGYGRTLMRNHIEFFYSSGVRHFDIAASLDNGGYTWARVGFLPTGHGEIRSLQSVLAEGSELLKRILPARERAILRRALSSEDPKMVWLIADLRFDVAPGLAKIFEKTADPSLSRRTQKRYAELGERIEEAFGATFNFDRYARKKYELPAGRALLTGTSWDATMHFKNVCQMKRVGAYVGGWRYLEIR